MRKLRLSKEVLTELAHDELREVAGGTHLCGITDPCTHVSLNLVCNSVDPRTCFGFTTPQDCLTNNCVQIQATILCL